MCSKQLWLAKMMPFRSLLNKRMLLKARWVLKSLMLSRSKWTGSAKTLKCSRLIWLRQARFRTASAWPTVTVSNKLCRSCKLTSIILLKSRMKGRSRSSRTWAAKLHNSLAKRKASLTRCCKTSPTYRKVSAISGTRGSSKSLRLTWQSASRHWQREVWKHRLFKAKVSLP